MNPLWWRRVEKLRESTMETDTVHKARVLLRSQLEPVMLKNSQPVYLSHHETKEQL